MYSCADDNIFSKDPVDIKKCPVLWSFRTVPGSSHHK